MKPYTYHIFCKPTNQHYYGSRYAKNCDPSDLWTAYFTSSKVVKQLIKQYGLDAFEVRVRKTFDTKEQAVLWECKVLERLTAAKRPEWINKHNGKGRVASGFAGRKHSIETRQKQAAAARGRKRPDLAERNRTNNPSRGRQLSEEHRRKIGDAIRGRKRPDLAERNRLRRSQSSPEKTP